MLRFSKKADYGLMAVHYIAFHQHDGVVNTKRIAEDLGIPSELLAKILQRLAKAKLIASVNGPKGGYVLATGARARSGSARCSRAIEGPLGLVGCYRTMKCPQLERCNIRRPVLAIQSGIERLPGDHDPGDDEYPERAAGRGPWGSSRRGTEETAPWR